MKMNLRLFKIKLSVINMRINIEDNWYTIPVPKLPSHLVKIPIIEKAYEISIKCHIGTEIYQTLNNLGLLEANLPSFYVNGKF